MPKYYEYKIAGYYLYFTSYCVIECMHVHASDRRLTEAGSAKFFVKENGDTLVQAENDHIIGAVCYSAGAVDRSVGNGIVQNCLLYVTAVNGMGSGCFYRFADRAADQSHANY